MIRLAIIGLVFLILPGCIMWAPFAPGEGPGDGVKYETWTPKPLPESERMHVIVIELGVEEM